IPDIRTLGTATTTNEFDACSAVGLDFADIAFASVPDLEIVSVLRCVAESIEQHPASHLAAGQSVDFSKRHRAPQFLEPVQKFVDHMPRAHRKSHNPHPLSQLIHHRSPLIENELPPSHPMNHSLTRSPKHEADS